jgi:hypothetical protein
MIENEFIQENKFEITYEVSFYFELNIIRHNYFYNWNWSKVWFSIVTALYSGDSYVGFGGEKIS